MNGRYETDDLEEPAPAAADREISLGTGAMLGIFFALVVVCGAFFGFGYSMGHKATPVVAPGAAAVDADAGGAAAPAVGGTKPALGSSDAAPEVVVKPSAGSGARTAATTAAAGSRRALPQPAAEPVAGAAATTTAPKPTVKPSIAAPSSVVETAAAPAAAAGTGSVYVQISAVSHQEDAQLLTTALKRRGYEPTVRHIPQDQLLHVQLGPFATKKEADAMRQRLSADGYNAILK